MAPTKIGLVGLGVIASKRHVPSIQAHDGFVLAGTASTDGAAVAGVPSFADHAVLLAADVDAVAICTPPPVRFQIACDALRAGKHVLLEKPPTATLGEIAVIRELAAERGLTAFTAWHSQFNAAVDRARALLAGRRLRRLQVTWKEHVDSSHAGQRWIWQPGGFGVFDPGINAFSILTKALPQPLLVTDAAVSVPANAAVPIAATLRFATPEGSGDLRADLDWLSDEVIRQIEIETEDGLRLLLAMNGQRLEADGQLVLETANEEYPLIYERFHELLRSGQSDVDSEPLRLVADACLVARPTAAPAFVSAQR